MDPAHDYRPIRALSFWVLFSAGFIGLVVLNLDLNASSAETSTNPVTDKANGLSFLSGILAGIWSRSLTNAYGLMMITAGLGCLLYAAAQWVALERESGFDAPPATDATHAMLPARTSFLHLITGRPFIEPTLLAAEKTHLDTGVDMLLYPLRYGQTLFPAVGFIGTILGISGAVRDLPKVIEDQSLDGLMAGLYVAFDTTFLGLVVAALLGISLVLLDLSHARLKSVRMVTRSP